MIQLNNGLIRSFLAKQGCGVPEPGRLHILGLRGATPVSVPAAAVRIGRGKPNTYDDSIILFGSVLACYPGTVDPGRTWTLKPSNPGGCAHLSNGGPYPYGLGKHKGRPALVPLGNIRIWRDRDRDGTQDGPEKVHTIVGSSIGLNIHAAGDGPTVDSWSAGCQCVCASAWCSFFSHIEASGQAEFQYYLADGKALIENG